MQKGLDIECTQSDDVLLCRRLDIEYTQAEEVN